MARPVKNNADYFSHDADMRNDPKVKALRRKYGFMGYALWCYLLEALTDSDFFVYEWNDLNVELLAGDFDCEPSELRDVVNYCIQLGLLTLSDGGELSCLRLVERFDALLSKRERDRSRVFADENPQSKVKESKGKKRKGEESKEDKEGKEDSLPVIGEQHLEILSKGHNLDIVYIRTQMAVADEYYKERGSSLTYAKLDAWLSRDPDSRKNPKNPNKVDPPYWQKAKV